MAPQGDAQTSNFTAVSQSFGKYVGPSACAATSCHGSVKPVPKSRILQNEYSTWVLSDKHSHAYQELTTDVGEHIAKILYKTKAEDSPKCLGCHALAPRPEQRARPFEATEGVTCENCHGPAADWLDQHTARESPGKHLQSVNYLHMVDTRNIISRAGKCVECHVGDASKSVNHEMIALGHPDLYFELDSFSELMSPHWHLPRLSAEGKPAEDSSWEGVRNWGTGQAVQLRAAMDLLAWRARGERTNNSDDWPEFSELSCIACHHDLIGPVDNWRQEHGYAGHRPGDPTWRGSSYIVLRLVAREVDPVIAQELELKLSALSKELRNLNSNRDGTANIAATVAPAAQKLAEHLASASYERGEVLRIMQSICEDSEEISFDDERAAAQATMALNALYIAYQKEARPPNANEVQTAIRRLFQQLENRSAYNAGLFAKELHRIRQLLR